MGVVRDFVVEHLAVPDGDGQHGVNAVAVLDETGQEKKGDHTAGVKRQYVGCAGQVANAINVVYCTYATPRGHAHVGARLYLPKEWATRTPPSGPSQTPARSRTTAPEPRTQSHQTRSQPEPTVSDQLADNEFAFKTKPALAVDILTDLHAAGVLPPWVTGDEVYGRDKALRAFCEEHGVGYVLGVPCSFTIRLNYRLKTRTDKAYFYCYVPQPRPATLGVLVTVAGMRWPVEEDFQVGKDQFALDHSQVRRYHALVRHLALAMTALAIAATTAATMRAKTSTLPPPPTTPDQDPPDDPGLIPLTVAETRRLLTLLTRTWHTRDHHLHWAWWRRRHQARARWYHQRTRLQRELNQLAS